MVIWTDVCVSIKLSEKLWLYCASWRWPSFTDLSCDMSLVSELHIPCSMSLVSGLHIPCIMSLVSGLHIPCIMSLVSELRIFMYYVSSWSVLELNCTFHVVCLLLVCVRAELHIPCSMCDLNHVVGLLSTMHILVPPGLCDYAIA